MRVAFFSDIHANLPALEAALADARERGALHLINLGDVVGYGPQPVECLARIREVASGNVLGNHDAAACGLLDPALFNPFARETAQRASLALDAEAKAWLRARPYILEGDGFACCHAGFEEPERFHYVETKEDAEPSFAALPDVPLLVLGHTHIPCLFAQEGGAVRRLPPEGVTLRPGLRLLANPGSIGFPRGDSLTADYLLLDTATGRLTFHAVPYDLAPYRLALVRNGYNPLNYWFLSPSARQRRREQAFLAPTRAGEAAQAPGFAPRGAASGRRAHRAPALLAAALAAALLAALAFLLVPTPDAATAIPRAQRAAANLLPPLAHWVGAGDVPGLERVPGPGDNTLALTPVGDTPGPRHDTLVSPFTPVPARARRLAFTFALRGGDHDALRCQARVVFLCADGRQRKDRLHAYSAPGEKSYTIPVPPDAIQMRAEFALTLPGPLAIEEPTLLLLERAPAE